MILYAENSFEPDEPSQAGLTEIGELASLKPYFDAVTCKITNIKTSVHVDLITKKIDKIFKCGYKTEKFCGAI